MSVETRRHPKGNKVSWNVVRLYDIIHVSIIKVSQRPSSTSNSRRVLSVPTPSQVIRVRRAEGSRCETSRTWNLYVPYPRLRVSFSSPHPTFPRFPKCEDAAHLFRPSKRSQDRKSFLTQREKLARYSSSTRNAKVQYLGRREYRRCAFPVNDRQRHHAVADDRQRFSCSGGL